MIRLAASTYFTDISAGPQPHRDERLFTTIAWNLTNGYGYSLNGEIPTARRPPVYPLFLAGLFYLFGKSWIVTYQ